MSAPAPTISLSGAHPDGSNPTIEFEQKLRTAFRPFHKQTTEHLFMKTFLVEKAISKEVYCQYLANLHSLYENLEEQLEQNKQLPYIEPLVDSNLFRKDKIMKDLNSFGVENPVASLGTQAVVDHIKEIGQENPHLLVAYAYTRYAGDLGGGIHAIKPVVDEIWSETVHSNFYNFDAWIKSRNNSDPNFSAFKTYCKIVNDLPLTSIQQDQIKEETLEVFKRTLEMFDELIQMPKWDMKSENGDVKGGSPFEALNKV